MQLTSTSITEGQKIPAKNAMGVPAGKAAAPGENLSPQLSWSGAPAGTKSYALFAIDLDAPTKADDVNRADRTVPYDLPRAEFVHWVLLEIPATLRELAEGADSNGMTPRGKPASKMAYGVRGLNDYTGWFAADPELTGKYAGYDGPWPPFNDERRHRYVFTIHALDVENVGLFGEFTLADARKAIEGHVLDSASITGWYAIYADAR